VRLWRKREQEWEKEREARERLMKEVFAERQKQIDRKMEVLRTKQAESIEEREDLLREIEYAKQQTSRSEAKRTDMITARAQELKEQVLEKQRQAALARQQYERELEEQRRIEEEYDNLLQVEEEAITARGYQPKVYSRKKYAWM
jgi:trichoplein keratin filament-binding protein